MASRTITIRVDEEIYGVLLEARHRLEMATGKAVSVGKACAFLVALSAVEPQGCPAGHSPEDAQG